MMIRSRHFSIVVGAIVALFMPACVMAQETDSQEIDATLVNQLCGIDLGLGDAPGFGTWQRDGSAYINDTKAFVEVFRDDFLTSPFGGCTVTIIFAGLGVTPSNVAIDPSHFSATFKGDQVDPSRWTMTSPTSADFGFRYYLNSVPNTLQPGTYRGGIVASVANAA